MNTPVVALAVTLIAGTSAASLGQSVQPATAKPIDIDKNSDAYRGGFSEGCEYATFGNTRNESRFRNDFNYHEGWVAGHKRCYAHQTINTNNDPNGPLKGLF